MFLTLPKKDAAARGVSTLNIEALFVFYRSTVWRNEKSRFLIVGNLTRLEALLN